MLNYVFTTNHQVGPHAPQTRLTGAQILAAHPEVLADERAATDALNRLLGLGAIKGIVVSTNVGALQGATSSEPYQEEAPAETPEEYEARMAAEGLPGQQKADNPTDGLTQQPPADPPL